MLWSWMNLKLDSGSFWESWEHLPGLGSGTWHGINVWILENCTHHDSYLHVSNWQPIWVGSLLFFKRTLKSVQNITDLKGTNCVATNSIFRGCEDTVYNLCFLPIDIASLHDRTHGFWENEILFITNEEHAYNMVHTRSLKTLTISNFPLQGLYPCW